MLRVNFAASRGWPHVDYYSVTCQAFHYMQSYAELCSVSTTEPNVVETSELIKYFMISHKTLRGITIIPGNRLFFFLLGNGFNLNVFKLPTLLRLIIKASMEQSPSNCLILYTHIP